MKIQFCKVLQRDQAMCSKVQAISCLDNQKFSNAQDLKICLRPEEQPYPVRPEVQTDTLSPVVDT